MNFLKKNPKKIETINDDFLTMQLYRNLNDVMQIETKNHANILRVIADSILSKYPIEMFSELIANHIRYTYVHCKECPFDDEVLNIAGIEILISGATTGYSLKYSSTRTVIILSTSLMTFIMSTLDVLKSSAILSRFTPALSWLSALTNGRLSCTLFLNTSELL